MIYWVSVDPERPEVLDVGIRNGLWGVVDDAREEIDPLEPGDFILFFHRDDGFVLCEVESEPYTETVPVWSEVDYPHRVRISEPVETDRYAHVAEVHECLRDPRTGEPFASAAKATEALERTAGSLRPLSNEEVRCLLRRLNWSLPPDVGPPAGEEPDADEPTEADEADEAGGEDAEREAEEADEPEAEDEPPADGPALAESAETERIEAESTETESAEAETPEAETTEAGTAEADTAEAAPAGEEEEHGPTAAGGPRVVLAPAAGNEASRGRWKATVEEGVPLDRLADHLPEEELDELRRGAGSDRVRVWGTAPTRDERSRSQWEDSGPGDVILFTGGGEIFASARVLATRRDEGLAEELWGSREDGDTWEFLFFATAPVPHAVSYEDFNEVAGYEPGYRIPRLNILGADRSFRILGTFPEFGIPAADEPETAATEPGAAGTEPGAAGTTEPDGAAPAERDEESSEPAEEPPATSAGEPAAGGGVGPMDGARLRRLLFGRRELGRCALCGRLLPVDLLEVVYVKPLEACTPEELEDVGNDVLPGCRLGCAGLFREGFVVVEDGVVRAGREEPRTHPVEARVDELTGQRCEYWHSGSEPYFRWHAAEHAGGGDG